MVLMFHFKDGLIHEKIAGCAGPSFVRIYDDTPASRNPARTHRR
jgi:hypothetical protein